MLDFRKPRKSRGLTGAMLIVALSMLLVVTGVQAALAHNVTEGDAGYIQQILGRQTHSLYVSRGQTHGHGL